MTDLKVFVETPLDICLARRLARDIVHRGRAIGLSVEQWSRYVKPNFEQHMRHTMYYSDMRIPRGIDNVVAIDLLTAHIRQQLQRKSNQHLDYLLSLHETSPSVKVSRPASTDEKTGQQKHFDYNSSGSLISNETEGAAAFRLERPPNLTILKQTNQVRGLHTILLNTTQTSRADFVFYFNRIADILLTEAFSLLDDAFFKQVPEIFTPTGSVVYNSVRPAGTIAAVAMIRGGGCFDHALRRVLGGDGRGGGGGGGGACRIDGGLGKVLIQSDARTGEPHLHALKLPPSCIGGIDEPRHQTREGEDEDEGSCTAQTRVLLLDSQLASGAAITMAAAILLDHGIREEDITVVAYLASDMAVSRISTAFPKLKIVVAHVDTKVYPRFIDSMYYGT